MLKGFVSGEEKDIKRIPMKGKNLFDKTTATIDYRVTASGTMYSENHACSDYINIEGLSEIAVSSNPSATNIYFYSSKTANADSYINDFSASIPAGAKYVRVNLLKTDLDTFMLNAGSTALPYEPYGYQEGWEVRDNQDRLIWGREDELQTATGTLPFKGYGLPVKVKSLLGNAVQNGTPSPQNIVTPEMCGVRTGNLWNYTIEQGGWDATSGAIPTKYASDDPKFTIRCGVADIIPIPSNTMSLTCPSGIKINFVWINTNGVSLGGSGWQQNGSTVTAPENATSMTFILGKVDDSTCSPNDFQNIMLNSGSTPLPYEPYGWKVPFENHGENLCYLYKIGYRLDNAGNEVEGANFNIYATPASANTTYTVNLNYGSAGSTTLRIIAYNSGSFSYKIAEVNLNSVPYTFTTPSACDEVKFSVSNQSTNIMLSLGSTPKPYSPYLNATIPVYLGEVPTVRRFKKLVLTGSETWYSSQQAGVFYTTAISTLCNISFTYNTGCISDSYVLKKQTTIVNLNSGEFTTDTNGFLWFKNGDYSTLTEWKQYLSQQYTEGHPVTVWYLLNVETMGIVNEPLMKIGRFADELTTVQVHGLSAPLYGIGDYKDTLNLSTGVVTRKVGKYIFKGTEEIRLETAEINRTVYYLFVNNFFGNFGFCTHIEWKSTYQPTEYDRIVYVQDGRLFISLSNAYLSAQTVQAFKDFLAAQYQAGTPVTIWYILSTPTTEAVTVPTGMTGEIEGYLTQVSTPSPTNRSVPKWNGEEESGGTYAVTVYTPPEIPTTTGQNTLMVDSNLAPSKLEVSVHAKKIHYGFKIDKSNDDSDSAVIYTHDAVTMTPAHMDFTNDRFDYGSWGNAFFVRDCYPVALNLDGTIAYRLDPDDYTKKTDGTSSDIFYELLTAAPSDWGTQWKQYYTKSGDEYILNDQGSAPTFATDTYYKLTYNSSFTGNFMMAFPKVWFYRHEDSQYNYIEISNYKLSDDWKCYAHINESGQEVDFIYLPLFKGVIVNSKLRSLPGQIPQGNTTATDEVNAATALGSRWQIWDHSSVECLNDLLTLMSKSIDSQGRFGQGRSSGYDSTDTVTYGKLQTGTLVKKGKFCGYSVTTKEVKVFGLEGFWANRLDRLQGMMLMNNVWKIKMTPPYNFTGTDFVTLSTAEVPSGTGFLSRVQTSEYGSIPASIANGSSTKYFKDPFFKSATNTRVALRGGSCTDGGNAGFRYINVDSAASISYWAVGASPVYK